MKKEDILLFFILGERVLLDTNVKIVMLLVLTSMMALASHRFGFLDTHLSLMNGVHINNQSSIQEGNLTSKFQKSKNGARVRCNLSDDDGFNLCGISIGLGEESPARGLNLSIYDALELDVVFQAPIDNQKLKVTFRNYNESYSTLEDVVSLKFNTISYVPSTSETPLYVPLQALQIENWWLAQYQIGFDHSQTDISNVSFIEFITFDMPKAGVYDIEVKNAVLRGQLLTEIELLKYIFLVWLVVFITLMIRQRSQLKRALIMDSVTQCYNRKGINQWVSKALVKHTVCLFYIDISGFKKINDAYGHSAGDELLVIFADRIKNSLYPFNENSAVISRLSSDEFLIAFKSLSEDQLEALVKELFVLLQAPFNLSGNKIVVNISLGVAKCSEDIRTFNELLAQADSALSYAKKSDLVRFKVFDEYVAEDIYYRKQVAEQLKNALSDDLLHLNFMPIYDSKSLKVEAVEVLLRCHSDGLKGVGPDVFIPVAEEYNLIKAIDLWVIEATFKKIKQERTLLADVPVTFCINISSAELHNVSFSLHLGTLLDKYQIRPNWIELEITETSFIETDSSSIQILNEIRSLGVRLALDDFGTGYTAFNQLINYPIDCLKIDKSFIDNIGSQNSTAESMIKAILLIAKSYKLVTIAEGIETRDQYHYLAENGCNFMQGYFLAKPMDWQNFRALLCSPQSESLLTKLQEPLIPEK
ncbi:EAL domain-containing protein [Marinomonas sp. 15G1-11]|uniref:EAL domain-containing protein n=1 Tax=Marinomonas phaeophyticola TaxID=3004091 RepID=A0ABT4JUI2_9GAMM|nr:GGDEF domain-containing phosphodiesterase [Marinomonas sp. 15G1-11]MCZ2721891.1 EAL domain-containing protein [Marinomonas sp. 15G1-11]